MFNLLATKNALVGGILFACCVSTCQLMFSIVIETEVVYSDGSQHLVDCQVGYSSSEGIN